MQSLLTKKVDRGFDATIRDATELPRGSAADGSQNVLYSRGTIKTPYGFGKVEADSLPLDSGNAVLFAGIYTELDKTQHFLSCTQNKIYRRDIEGSQWNDITQAGVSLGGGIYSPMSIASVLHTDGLALNGTGNSWYHHCLVSTGGVSPIQRWAGKFETDFADLLGADGYHTVGSGITKHYAEQVGAFYNRVILVNPKEADANGNLIDNNQRLRWPQAGKLETWNGTGSGYRDLLDTGGSNMRGALLGTQWIQYQNNSIWSLTHVGGTRVFEPDIEIPDLGLLAPYLLYSKNNVHYFVGNDYNLYAYYSGSNIVNIGRKIQRFLERDLDSAYIDRCWLYMGAENSRLWLYIVPNGKTEVTQAYGIDIHTGSWMKRDFTHKWTTGGVTCVSLVGASSYYAGQSYREAINSSQSPSKNVAIGGAVRSSNVVTVTTDIPHGFIVGETVTLAGCDSGGETDAFDGDHTIASKPSTTTFTFSQTGADEANGAAGTATVDKAMTYQDAVNIEETYRQALQETLIKERIVLADSTGYVYQHDDDLTQDDGIDIPSRHITEVYDLGLPGKNKLWPGIRITAKGTGVIVSYRTGNFETTDTGWTAFAEQELTSEFTDYKLTIWDTSKKIQFRFTNADGDDFQISNYEVIEPTIMAEV